MSNENNSVPFGLKKDGTPAKKRGRPPKQQQTTPVPGKVKLSTVASPKIEQMVEAVTVSDKEQRIVNKILKEMPEKKRGRPSKTDLMARQKVEEKIKEIVVEKIQEQGILDYHVYKEGEYVRKSSANPNFLEKWDVGMVSRQDISSQWVFVYWNDGTKYWMSSKSLTPYKK